MSLNPMQAGKQVVDQFGRYILTSFPVADQNLERQFKEALQHGGGGERLLTKGPYVYLNQPFEQGPGVDALISDASLGLHRTLKGVFPFQTLHKHQENALRAIKEGFHVVMATGTGSGKTEGFLIPIVDHCLHLKDQKAEAGVVAVLVYPMNALVNDQIKRLRPLLAGTGITFGRYTGETPATHPGGVSQLDQSRAYTKDELKRAERDQAGLLIPWEECYSRKSILERKPRLLLTNYSQLEYLLLRDKDLDLFRGAPVRFLVMDEVHTYTGELGSEVACLIRRLKHVAGKTAEEVLCIGTSATVGDSKAGLNPDEAIREFAHRLFGVPAGKIRIIGEVYKKVAAPGPEAYIPALPKDMGGLLTQVLDATQELHLLDEVDEIPDRLLAIAETLCGQKAPTGTNNLVRLYQLLRDNRVVFTLSQVFGKPMLFEEALPRLRSLGDRAQASDETLISEVMAYLTLGAIAREDEEPLLRPKLHYFVQGLQGVWCSWEEGDWRVHFKLREGKEGGERTLFPLELCRACGQHYFKVIAETEASVRQAVTGVAGVRACRIPKGQRDAPSESESFAYFTDRLATRDESPEKALPKQQLLCTICGTLHQDRVHACANDKCKRSDGLIEVWVFEERVPRCIACGATDRGGFPPVRASKTFTVSDVTILSQSLLTAMPERSLQKLLVFADNRQEAAFQAGWMEERSRRFRLRHLLYRILHQETSRIWTVQSLTEQIIEEGQAEGILPAITYERRDQETRIKWFLLEEIASHQQRRSSVENLGLAKVSYDGLSMEANPRYFMEWAQKLGVAPENLLNLTTVILDYYRRRGVVSDSLLQRLWTNKDVEVRKGLIVTSQHYRPRVLVPETLGKKDFTLSWVAPNHRSSAQEITRKALEWLDAHKRDEFLKTLWSWLRAEELLVPAKLFRKYGGRLQPLDIQAETVQINVEKLGLSEASIRSVCTSCRLSQSVPLPEDQCPEYQCSGKTRTIGRDEENYDVVQYTRLPFVPLKTYEHSAQVDKDQREKVEREFKREDGQYNCLVCTPTLELGVDIGKLEMVLMRNVPPSPSNYAQRSGRAGRRHRIALVFTYCRDQQHDRYFFEDPPSMISGTIRVPAFSMQNEPLVRKQIHSTALTALRALVTKDEQEILTDTFPPYIWHYFGERVPSEGTSQGYRMRYSSSPATAEGFRDLVEKYREPIQDQLISIFHDHWPEHDRWVVGKEPLSDALDAMSNSLAIHLRRLFQQVQTYNKILERLRRVEDENASLTEDEREDRRRYESARAALEREDQAHYSLSYLCNDGFFPGYAMSRESVLAQCFDPFQEISRPSAVALRELTPANWVYANKKIFSIHRINFYRLRTGADADSGISLSQTVHYDPRTYRLVQPGATGMEGGEKQVLPLTSYPLTEIEMRLKQSIDDHSDSRRSIAFKIGGLLLPTHGGGEDGKVGQKSYSYLRRRDLRLVNLGKTKLMQSDPSLIGFPVCPRCGETRDPSCSQAEFSKFVEDHRRLCHVARIGRVALHVDMTTDILRLGPYPEERDAVNVLEGIRVGARQILDMGETEIEGIIESEGEGAYWVVLYDPLPGGSGFLPLFLKYWVAIIEAAQEVLSNCPEKCEDACYACLLHFRNQFYHGMLDRHRAVELLAGLLIQPEKKVDVPPVLAEGRVEADTTDSDKEVDFVDILRRRGFPLPTASQFVVDLGGGSSTIADWAYPEQQVLIFVDGMSKGIHGNQEQQRKDRLARAKAKVKGFQVLEITAQALSDETVMDGRLEELAIYLDQS